MSIQSPATPQGTLNNRVSVAERRLLDADDEYTAALEEAQDGHGWKRLRAANLALATAQDLVALHAQAAGRVWCRDCMVVTPAIRLCEETDDDGSPACGLPVCVACGFCCRHAAAGPEYDSDSD